MFLRNTGVRLSSPPPIIKNRLFQAVLLFFIVFLCLLFDTYSDKEIIYGEQKIINLRNRSYFFTENKNVLLEHKPKTIEKNQ